MHLKFCVVHDDYLTYLQSFDPKVMNPSTSYNANAKTKFVVGVLIEINGFSYYAELSSIKTEQVNVLDPSKLHHDYKDFCYPIVGKVKDGTKNVNVLKSLIRLGFMFPVHEAFINDLNFRTLPQPYQDLVTEEYRYCKKNIEQIRAMALEIYNKRTTDAPTNHTIRQCCDFKLLEEKLTQRLKANAIS